MTIVGFALVGYLAFESVQPTPLSLTDAAVFGVLAAAVNVLATFAFASVGAVTPTHARTSVARLLTIARTLTTRYTKMTQTLETETNAVIATEARVMNAEVYTAILTLTDAINDWNEVQGEALTEVLKDAQ